MRLSDVLSDAGHTPTPPATLLLSVEEAMAELRISRTQLWRLWHSGQLRSVSIGRRRLFRRSDLAAFAERL